MTQRRAICLIVLCAVVLCAVVTVSTDARQAPPQTFRAGTSVVTLNVSVMQRRRPVPGLVASDFSVTDNDVPQRVERVSFEEVPIDVTIVLDVSGSTFPFAERLRRDATRILGLLRPRDRIRLLAVNTYVHEVLPLQSPSPGARLPSSPEQGGEDSLYDALAGAVIAPADPDRRRLVVALADGGDSLSVNEMSTVREVAQRSDAVVYVVLMASPGVRAAGPRPYQSQHRAAPIEIARSRDRGRHEMRALAEETGGAYYENVGTDSAELRDPIEVLERVLDEFKQSYVLQFTPTGVSDDGWHALRVQVKGIEPAGVRARAGYFAGAP